MPYRTKQLIPFVPELHDDIITCIYITASYVLNDTIFAPDCFLSSPENESAEMHKRHSDYMVCIAKPVWHMHR